MKWKDWLNNWNMTSLKMNASFLEMQYIPRDQDRKAAWELYIELLTRIYSQPLEYEDDESQILNSLYTLFPLIRNIIIKYGPDCSEFTKISIIILNQIIRPFTACWHKQFKQGKSIDSQKFRHDYLILLEKLMIYTRMLADMAGVEDLTMLTKV